MTKHDVRTDKMARRGIGFTVSMTISDDAGYDFI